MNHQSWVRLFNAVGMGLGVLAFFLWLPSLTGIPHSVGDYVVLSILAIGMILAFLRIQEVDRQRVQRQKMEERLKQYESTHVKLIDGNKW